MQCHQRYQLLLWIISYDCPCLHAGPVVYETHGTKYDINVQPRLIMIMISGAVDEKE